MSKQLIYISDVSSFYDQFSKKLLHDYIYGNLRFKEAISCVCKIIPNAQVNILDMGCGIGYSSSEYKYFNPLANVLWVDISPECIHIAQSLFSQVGLRFLVSDLTEFSIDEKFDIVALIDVYEHIPRIRWPKFNKIISELLNRNGTLVLSTPSPMHQAYLQEYNPKGIQIIDEIVSPDDLFTLARDVNAYVMSFNHVSIWRHNDYQHIVMKRNPPPVLLRSRNYFERTLNKITNISNYYRNFQRRSIVRKKLDIVI